MQRNFNTTDKLIIATDNFIKTIFGTPNGTGRISPATTIDSSLSTTEQQHSAALMRINHCGEVCAQALYQGQALTAKDSKLQAKLMQASREENDHLLWCAQRLAELNSRPSYLNIFWYSNSFIIGTFAGIIGDKWSLGFLAQTEAQVCKHLSHHLMLLPHNDKKSQAILSQMYDDETKHENTAIALGAATLPETIKLLMKVQAKVMTTLTYYI